MSYTDLATMLKSTSWGSLQDCDPAALSSYRDALWYALAQLPDDEDGTRLADDRWEFRAKFEGSTVWEAGVYIAGAPALVLDLPTSEELLLLNLLSAAPPLVRAARALLAYDTPDVPDDAAIDEFIAVIKRLEALVPQLDRLMVEHKEGPRV